MSPEYKHTAGNHAHAFMFLNVFWMNDTKFWTVSTLLCSCLYPKSIKCITQKSESNLGTRFLQHFNTLAVPTSGFFFFLMPSVLCCGSAILSWRLTTVSHASWEHSVYFLSLLNLWKKRASPLSCLPTTAVMLCYRIGPVSRVQRDKYNPGKEMQIHSEVSC